MLAFKSVPDLIDHWTTSVMTDPGGSRGKITCSCALACHVLVLELESSSISSKLASSATYCTNLRHKATALACFAFRNILVHCHIARTVSVFKTLPERGRLHCSYATKSEVLCPENYPSTYRKAAMAAAEQADSWLTNSLRFVVLKYP